MKTVAGEHQLRHSPEWDLPQEGDCLPLTLGKKRKKGKRESRRNLLTGKL